MKKKTNKLSLAIAGVVAAGFASQVAQAALPKWATDLGLTKDKLEKCKGVAAAKMNDCGANAHGCTSQGTVFHKDEWIYVPKGLCKHIHNGEKKE